MDFESIEYLKVDPIRISPTVTSYRSGPSKVDLASIVAELAHSATGQLRKYTKEPYFNHCQEVASLVAQVDGCTEEMVCAAYLHDVVEDTAISIEQIETYFGPIVKYYVWCLTDSDLTFGNRELRKAADRKRLAAAPYEVQTIKYADLISNTSSIVERDPKFAVLYLKEKQLLLEVMTQGDSKLRKRAAGISNVS